MRRANSLEKTLMLGKIEGGRRRGRQRIRWLDGITETWGTEFEQAPGVGDGQGGLACCTPWGRKEADTTERLNWTVLNGKKADLIFLPGLCHWRASGEPEPPASPSSNEASSPVKEDYLGTIDIHTHMIGTRQCPTSLTGVMSEETW